MEKKQKIVKGIAKILIPIVFLGASGCMERRQEPIEKKEVSGVILKESFYSATGGFNGNPDRYSVLIMLPDSSEKRYSLYGKDAREANLYDKGDTIKFTTNLNFNTVRLKQK